MAFSSVDFQSLDWHLEDTFPLHKSRREVAMCCAKISSQGLSIAPLDSQTLSPRATNEKSARKSQSSELMIKPIDILGCSWHKPSKADVSSVYFTIFAYPLIASKKPPRRKRHALTLEFKKDTSFQKNLDYVSLWEKAVHCVLRQKTTPANNTDTMTSDGKLLILINPHSGPGKAYQIFRKQVVPVLSEAGAVYDVIITQRANHAQELLQGLSLHLYQAIAVVAGDGLLYEVYNGLGSRPDWQTALSIPVCIVPGGSGNGLAKSLAYWKGEPYENGLGGGALGSALNLTRGSPAPMDLVVIHTHTGQRLFSFLSFGIGLLSDIDIESERLRVLGDTRFTVWAFAKVAALRKYSITVSFKRASGYHEPLVQLPSAKKRPAFARSQTVQEETFSTPPQSLKRGSVPAIAHQRSGRQQHRQLNHSLSCEARVEQDAEESDSSQSSISLGQFPSLEKVVKEDEKAADLQEVKDKSGRGKENEAPRDMSPGSEEDSFTANSLTKDVGKVQDGVYEDASSSLPVPTKRKKTSTRKADYSHLPHYQDLVQGIVYENDDESPVLQNTANEKRNSTALGEPVPDDWETITGEFLMVYAVYQSHISNNVLFAPHAAPDDGIIWLFLMPGSMSRASVVKFLLSMETGNHESVPGVLVLPVTAVRLQPHDSSGLLTVDGEVVPFGPMHAEIMPSHARVMVR